MVIAVSAIMLKADQRVKSVLKNLSLLFKVDLMLNNVKNSIENILYFWNNN